MKFRFGSILFQFKLTLLFVIFGLIVGYSSYLVTTISKTKMLVDQFLDTNNNPIFKISNNYKNDWMLELSSPESSVNNSREFIQALIPTEFKDSIIVEFFYKNSEDNIWYLLRDTSKPWHPPTKVNSNTIPLLEDVLNVDIIVPEHSFFKLADSTTLYLNLTENGDINSYAVRITINREHLIHYITKSKKEWLVYTIMILVISFILGSLFAKSITRPIRKLTDSAVNLSHGQLDIRFKTKRKDDIGYLARALNDMAINIENKIHTIETMNRIDKAVNSSLSRKHLLDKVSGFIAEQFDNSAVFVLDRSKMAYFVLSYAPENIKFLKTKFNFDELPDKFSSKILGTFSFDNKIMEYIKQISPDIKKYSSGISIPLKQSEQLVGLLVVVKDFLEDREKESLVLLADQVSVALLSMKEVEDREQMYNAMLLSLTRSVDIKSRWTAGHSERVTSNATALAKRLGLSSETQDMVRIASLLHDLGKLGIPEAILDKPGKLTDNEYDLIREHPVMGEEIIKDIPNFEMVKSVVRHHHERWDGKGYPDGLEKDTIPIIARIVAIADVWDAITADRPYRKGFSYEKAVNIMESEREKLFDPYLLDIFLEIIDQDNN